MGPLLCSGFVLGSDDGFGFNIFVFFGGARGCAGRIAPVPA